MGAQWRGARTGAAVGPQGLRTVGKGPSKHPQSLAPHLPPSPVPPYVSCFAPGTPPRQAVAGPPITRVTYRRASELQPGEGAGAEPCNILILEVGKGGGTSQHCVCGFLRLLQRNKVCHKGRPPLGAAARASARPAHCARGVSGAPPRSLGLQLLPAGEGTSPHSASSRPRPRTSSTPTRDAGVRILPHA